eukprot:s682_g16.t1
MRNGATMPPFAVWCLALVAVPLPEASGDAREAHHRPQMRREPLQHRCSEAERCETHDPGPMSSCMAPDGEAELSHNRRWPHGGRISLAPRSPRRASVGGLGDVFAEDDDSVCKSLCHAVDAPWQIKLSNASREICNICSGGAEFLPDATAFMEDGKPFSCQFALDQIRAGGSRLTCQEAAEENADCCARSDSDGKPGSSDRTDNWSCELCAGFGDLNSTAVAMDNLRSGRAPISCEVARDSSLVARCCRERVDDDAAVGLQNCSICGAGETFDAESIAYTTDGEMLTCEDAYSRLQDGSVKNTVLRTSCEDAQGKLQGKCCKCYLCSEGQSLIPDAAAEHIEGPWLLRKGLASA